MDVMLFTATSHDIFSAGDGAVQQMAAPPVTTKSKRFCRFLGRSATSSTLATCCCPTYASRSALSYHLSSPVTRSSEKKKRFHP